MGVCHSAFDDRFERAAASLGPFLDKLGMDDKEAKKFYAVFEKVDQDLEGGVSLDEFFDYFDLEFSTFAQRAFAIMDVDKTSGGKNSLDFGEFLAGIYNYCTMQHDVLVKFAFDLFDSDSSGTIDRKEIKELVLMVYGKKKLDENLEKFINRYDKDRGGSIDLAEWRESEKRNRTMLFPAFELQRQMRDSVLGESYWLKATRTRASRLRNLDVIDVYYKVMTGKALKRGDAYEDTSYRKDGTIRSEIADDVEVLDSPREGASVVKTLAREQEVHIYGEREDASDASMLWYLINANAPQWIKADVVKLDATWAKFEREQKMKRETEAKRQEEAQAEAAKPENKKRALKDTFVEHKDEESGMVYWYNTETGESTWTDPFK